ncbi:transposable element Tcb1 transposase [Trichonephila clavipes]|nr:transposable element Tcb1 transposase [Trichonephila clavipes]
MLNSCVMHRHIGPAPGIMVWTGIGYHFHTPLVHIVGTLNNQRYISEVLVPVVLPYLQGLATIELLLFPARSPDLSLIENMWSMVAQRLTQITPPAATPDQFWQRVEAAWFAVPQEHIQFLFE